MTEQPRSIIAALRDIVNEQTLLYVESLPPEKRALMELPKAELEMLSKEDRQELFMLWVTITALNGEPAKPDESVDLVSAYAKHGLIVERPKGGSWHSKTMMAAPHDGVQYCVDNHGHHLKAGREDSILHGIWHREQLIKRHHAMIKTIYEYCVALEVGDIWVLCSGGAQLQAFFGNKTGYLAILYLDMEDENERVDDDYLKAVGNQKLTLQVNWKHNNPLFVGKFKMPGVKLRKST